MKRILLLTFGLAASAFLSAQTADKWEHVYGGSGTEYGYSVKSCLDQGYIVAGTSSTAGISDGYVVRTDSLGLVMWSKYYIGNNVDVLRSIRLLPDSGFVMAGYSNSQGNGGYDGWVIRADKNGDTLWTRYIGTPDWDFFYDVYPTWDSGFVFSGGTYGLGNGDEDMYFVKLDKNGNTVWTKTYGGTKTDEAHGIVQTGDSMIAACGFSHSLGDTLGDSWILRMDMNGDTLWTRTIPGYDNKEDKCWGICDNYSTGRVFICGQVQITAGNEDPYFATYFYNGNFQFIDASGGAQDEIFRSIVARPNGTCAALGSNFTTGAGMGDMFLFHNRNTWTSTTYGTLQVDEGFGLDLAHDDGYIACGYTEGFNSVLPNMYLIKIDTNGVTTGVLGIHQLLAPAAPSGSANVYPNPGQNEISVTFSSESPITGEISMTVYDLSGRQVLTVPATNWHSDSDKSAYCIVNTAALPQGVYQYFLSDANDIKALGKLVITR